MYAYSSILAALIERGQHRQGRRIDVSMLESMVEWMGYPLYYAFDGAAPPPRSRRRARDDLSVRAVPRRRRRHRDARPAERARVAASSARSVLEQPALAADPRFASNAARTAAREALRAIIVEAFATLDRRRGRRAARRGADRQRARQHDGRTSGPSAAAARGRWTEVDTPAGPIPALLPPGMPSDAATRAWTRCRRSAQHTDAILAELGLDAAAIARAARSRARSERARTHDKQNHDHGQPPPSRSRSPLSPPTSRSTRSRPRCSTAPRT